MLGGGRPWWGGLPFDGPPPIFDSPDRGNAIKPANLFSLSTKPFKIFLHDQKRQYCWSLYLRIKVLTVLITLFETLFILEIYSPRVNYCLFDWLVCNFIINQSIDIKQKLIIKLDYLYLILATDKYLLFPYNQVWKNYEAKPPMLDKTCDFIVREHAHGHENSGFFENLSRAAEFSC